VGTKVPWNKSSWERKFHVTFAPGDDVPDKPGGRSIQRFHRTLLASLSGTSDAVKGGQIAVYGKPISEL